MRAVLLLLCVVAVLGAPKLHRKNGKLEKILQNEQLVSFGGCGVISLDF